MSIYKGNKCVAGGVGTNLPLLGAVQGFLITPTDLHWVLADGSTVDATLHPRLAEVMPVLPDLRECVLVGAGKNTHNTIAAHDVYTVGQFKDDQMQARTHTSTQRAGFQVSGTGYAVASSGLAYGSNTSNNASGRTGSTTHGKQIGVMFYVWAD